MDSAESKYVVVTPARDEEACLRLTIESMLAQTLRPAAWIIVDDGSRDGTAAIIEEYARSCPWIRGWMRQDRGRRLPGAGVVEAFYDGYHQLQGGDWEFLVKLDADLSFAPDFPECLGALPQTTAPGDRRGSFVPNRQRPTATRGRSGFSRAWRQQNLPAAMLGGNWRDAGSARLGHGG